MEAFPRRPGYAKRYSPTLERRESEMQPKLTKSERRHVQELAGLAWERQLRDEIGTVGDAIREMEADKLCPHEVNDIIHRYHNGASRDLYMRYSDSLPWFALCRAYFDGVITDDDLSHTSDNLRSGIATSADSFNQLHRIEDD